MVVFLPNITFTKNKSLHHLCVCSFSPCRKLLLHPNGNKNKGVSDHISLYLVLVEPNSLGPAWEIRAVFRLFLLDQNNDCYLTLQGK